MRFKMTLRFVALTLTAAAKVWFAEMHWTPGLPVLLQAEDRVHHRLEEQKANVSILYFAAPRESTLDDIFIMATSIGKVQGC